MSSSRSFYTWRPHPWHGLHPGESTPHVLQVYIEMTPFDYVKYEVDKVTGYLKVDRPQRTSSQPPALYGFIPQTFCGERVAKLSPNASKGDGDPLDICVISERPITRADIILRCIPIGGLQMIDEGEADDKIIAILENDPIWGEATSISSLSSSLIERIRHYFLTYKLRHNTPSSISIDTVFDVEHAHLVIQAAMEDYKNTFG